ncbi:MAG TPA: hypothetical protein VF153_01735, partial [Candidatus Limnocylindria bacterium]
AADVVAAAETLAEVQARLRDVSDGVAGVLSSAIDGWDSRVAVATILAGAARGLLPWTGDDEADLGEALDEAERAVPAKPALPLDATGKVDAAWQALGRLTALEAATRAVLTSATALGQLQAIVASAPAVTAAARQMLPHTGEQRNDLTDRLDRAAARLAHAKPGWWRDTAAQLTTAAEIDDTARGLAGDEPGQVSNAAGDLLVVFDDIAEAAELATDVSRLAQVGRGALPLVGDMRPDLQLQLDAAEFAESTGPAWPGLEADSVAEVAAAAREWDRLRPSLDQLQAAVRAILEASARDLRVRRDAALDMADRARKLVDEAGPLRDQLAVGLDRAVRAVRAVQLPEGPLDTTQRMEDTYRALRSLAGQVTNLMAAIGSVWQPAVLAPARQIEAAVQRLEAETERLLPYTDQEDALRDQLLSALEDMGTRVAIPSLTARPDTLTRRRTVRSVRGRSRPASTTGTPTDIRSEAGTGTGDGPVPLSRRRTVRVAARQQPRDAAEISAAQARLDRLRDPRAFRDAVTAALDAGWQPRLDTLRSQITHASQLLGQIGDAPASERPRALERIEAELSTVQRPQLPESPTRNDMARATHALATVTNAAEVVTAVLTEATSLLRTRLSRATEMAREAQALLPYAEAQEPELGTALGFASRGVDLLPGLPARLPATEAGTDAARDLVGALDALEDVTGRIIRAAVAPTGAAAPPVQPPPVQAPPVQAPLEQA